MAASVIRDLNEDTSGSAWSTGSKDGTLPTKGLQPHQHESIADTGGNEEQTETGNEGQLGNTDWSGVHGLESSFVADYRCKCGNCEIMPTTTESICYQEINKYQEKCEAVDPPIMCFTLHSSFNAVCLNTDVLDTAYYQYHQQYNVDDTRKRLDEKYRHVAYRQVSEVVLALAGQGCQKTNSILYCKFNKEEFPFTKWAV